MKIDQTKLKKSSSEVPPDCKALIENLKSCTTDELVEELSKIKTWNFGECELYHWIDVLDTFDHILEIACEKTSEDQWVLPCDGLMSWDKLKPLLLAVLQFTALLIKHSLSLHFYNSMEHLTTLLSSSDMNVVLAVLNLLYVFSKKSNFTTRLNAEKRQTLLSQLFYLAESWGGKENGFGLAKCCQNLPITAYPPTATTLHFEYYAQNESHIKVLAIHVENVDKILKSPAQIMEELLQKYDVPEDKQMQLFTHIRFAHSFSDYPKRLLCIQARLQALSVLANCNAFEDNIDSLSYNSLMEELVDVLKLQDNSLIELKAAASRTMTSIKHFDSNPEQSAITDTTGAASYHGFLPVRVRNCIQALTEKVVAIHPADTQLFYVCLYGWMNIQQSRLRVLSLQRKLNNYLVLYMRKRQKYLRMVEIFNGPKMMCLLEHIRSPVQFQKLFRIKLQTFFKMKEILYSKDAKPSGWMPEIELLLFLFWLSGGLSYKKVEKLLGVPENILHTMFQSIFERFLKEVCHVIQFPKKNFNYLSKGFSKLTGSHIFGLAVGCLDAFHVSISFPSQKVDLHFLNDKDEFSVQVQTVCDYRGALMDIAVGFPGSMLKPHILHCTPLYLGRLLPPPGYVLLSGRGYPCLLEPVCIVPPFITAYTPEQNSFNKHLERIHSVLRKSVGQMFDRWSKIFSKPIMYPLSDITNIIIACAMIHNIGLEMEDVWPKERLVNFSVNKEYLSLVEGQKSGEMTQKNMAQLTVPFVLPLHDESNESSENTDD